MTRILIIDDDPDVVETSKMVLAREGYQVAHAYDTVEGYKAIDSFNPDLLILDVIMVHPDDGIAMAQQLRAKGFKKPILMLTSIGKVSGYTYDKDESVLPVDAFVPKPVAPSVLVEKVRALLAGKEK